jgi:hypothetical protein
MKFEYVPGVVITNFFAGIHPSGDGIVVVDVPPPIQYAVPAIQV